MVVGMSAHTGARLAEVGFLLLLLGGVWLALAQVAFLGMARGRTVVAGLAFAVAGLLLIIAVHWGQFG